jgi:hypothetical protein
VRFAEIALLAMPFVVFVAWRMLAPNAGPPKILVISVSATVVIMAGLLLLLWYQDASPPGTGYVPARIEDGRVVPSHVDPVTPGRAEPITTGQASPATPATK